MIHLLLGTILLAAIDSQELTGKYLRYEGGEYESAFIPCGSNEVWSVNGGPAITRLINDYNDAPKNKYGEVMVVLQLNVMSIDKSKYPQSHYAATATVTRVVSIGDGVTCEANS